MASKKRRSAPKRNKSIPSRQKKPTVRRLRRIPKQFKFALGPAEAQTDLILETRKNVRKLKTIPKLQPLQAALSLGPAITLKRGPNLGKHSLCKSRQDKKAAILKNGFGGKNGFTSYSKRSMLTCK